MGNNFTLQWIVAEIECGLLLRDFLKKKHISRAALTDIKFKGGHIFVDGQEKTVRYQLTVGEQVKVVFPSEIPSEDMVAENIPLNIIYEDDYVLVIDKPTNLPTIPSREHRSGTLANGLLYYYQKNAIPSTVHIVTRLDKDTSGLLLVAKNRFVHHILSGQQREKKVKRTYLALVYGELSERKGTINAPIGRKTTSIIEREVREDGQEAITHFQVEKSNGNITLVKVRLETGRTHQIRVHFAYLGHSLLGDSLYGGKTDKINRQALHSTQLSFYHPLTDEKMTFQSDIPSDMGGIM